jgi:hypothetical protein
MNYIIKIVQSPKHQPILLFTECDFFKLITDLFFIFPLSHAAFFYLREKHSPSPLRTCHFADARFVRSVLKDS